MTFAVTVTTFSGKITYRNVQNTKWLKIICQAKEVIGDGMWTIYWGWSGMGTIYFTVSSSNCNAVAEQRT